jgi:hypothetical protein
MGLLLGLECVNPPTVAAGLLRISPESVELDELAPGSSYAHSLALLVEQGPVRVWIESHSSSLKVNSVTVMSAQGPRRGAFPMVVSPGERVEVNMVWTVPVAHQGLASGHLLFGTDEPLRISRLINLISVSARGSKSSSKGLNLGLIPKGGKAMGYVLAEEGEVPMILQRGAEALTSFLEIKRKGTSNPQGWILEAKHPGGEGRPLGGTLRFLARDGKVRRMDFYGFFL